MNDSALIRLVSIASFMTLWFCTGCSIEPVHLALRVPRLCRCSALTVYFVHLLHSVSSSCERDCMDELLRVKGNGIQWLGEIRGIAVWRWFVCCTLRMLYE